MKIQGSATRTAPADRAVDRFSIQFRAISLLSALTLTPALAVAGSPVQPEDLLVDFCSSLEPLRNSSVEMVQITTANDAKPAGATRVIKSSTMRAGEGASSVYQRWTNVANPDALGATELHDITQYVISDGRLFGLQKLAGRPEPILYVFSTIPEHQVAAWQGAFLGGYFPGDEGRIDTVLQSARATIRSAHQFVDDVWCVVMDASNRGTLYTVWFAPERGGGIQKLVKVVEGEALRSAQQLNQPLRVTLTLDQVKFKQFGEHWIPVTGRLTQQIDYANRGASILVTTVERKHVELNPDSRRVPVTPEIPNGTVVRFVGASNAIPHEWRDGKIIPREDKEATARLDAIVAGKRFETDADQASKWALVRGPAMFLGMVSVLMGLLRLGQGFTAHRKKSARGA